MRVLRAIVFACVSALPTFVSAHEEVVHADFVGKAILHLKNARPDLGITDQCAANLNTHIQKGVVDEDQSFSAAEWPIGRYFFHFREEGPDTPLIDRVSLTLPIPGAEFLAYPAEVEATCDMMEWSNARQPSCAARISSLLWSPNHDASSNLYSFDDMKQLLLSFPPGSLGHNQGLEALGHYLHLLQDLTSPAHTRNDGHPHLFAGIGDPSAVERIGPSMVLRALVVTPPAGAMLAFQNEQQAFDSLQAWTKNNFWSEKNIFIGPGPLFHESDGVLDEYALDVLGRRIAYRTFLTQRYTIDDQVARDQFFELAPQAILYTASMMAHLADTYGIKLCPPPSLSGVITFDDVGAGTVLSRCQDAGAALPNCGGGQVINVYPGVTFYSQASGFSGPVTGQAVVVATPPPPALIPNSVSSNHACAQGVSGPDCRARVFVRFSAPVRNFKYDVVGGYTFRSNQFLTEDFFGVITGGFNLFIDSARMFFVWNRTRDLSIWNFGITQFELSISNGVVASFGLEQPVGPPLGGLGLDAIRFEPVQP